jgi:hypothetical protein
MTLKEVRTELNECDYPERFKKILYFVLDWEAAVDRKGNVYVENVSGDSGGRTYLGVDQASHKNFDYQNPEPKAAFEIYFKEYWKRFNCADFPTPLGEVYFDTAVNTGKSRADKILAVAGSDAGAFLDERRDFYNRLAAQKPGLRKFLKGWLNRVNALERHVGL